MQNAEPNSPDQPRKRRRWPWATALPVTLAAGFVIGFFVHQPETVRVPTVATVQKERAMDRRSNKLDQREAKHERLAEKLDRREKSLDERERALDERAKALDEREARISQQEKVVAQNTITDGVWTVGVDIEPGTYRATYVPSGCYWAITASGSNGTEIIQNGIPGGGNPSVTLSEGQDFTSQRCGKWHKQQD